MKAKEWWIYNNAAVGHPATQMQPNEPEFYTHVVEYSAYTHLSSELDSTTECLIAEQNMRDQDQLELRLALEVIKQIEQLAARPHKKAIDDIRQLCYGILVKYEIADPEQV